VISARDGPTVYEVPLNFHQEGLDAKIVEKLNIWTRGSELRVWEDIIDRFKHPTGTVTIGIVGKYVHLVESYKSLNEALIHGGLKHRTRVQFRFINSEQLEGSDGEAQVEAALRDVDGVLVPGGFGERGIEGKIRAIRYARENNRPFLGICLGMQLAVIEFARNILGLEGAGSREFEERCAHPVIDLMEEQKQVVLKGGTMRLGAFPCQITPRTLAHEIYGALEISERHRHRYEVNNKYRRKLEAKGMVISGIFPASDLVEMVELKTHPWFFGTQAHPEFKSSPMEAHPIFAAFIHAALEHRLGTLKPRGQGKVKNGAPASAPARNATRAEARDKTVKSSRKKPSTGSSLES
jgi:CTP synthase